MDGRSTLEPATPRRLATASSDPGSGASPPQHHAQRQVQSARGARPSESVPPDSVRPGRPQRRTYSASGSGLTPTSSASSHGSSSSLYSATPPGTPSSSAADMGTLAGAALAEDALEEGVPQERSRVGAQMEPEPEPEPEPGLGSQRPSSGPPLNDPGEWFAMISYTQRNANAKALALQLYATLRERQLPVWLDTKMSQLNEAAMKEAAQGSRCVIAIVTGPCFAPEDLQRTGDPEKNAYFKRPYCMNELRWAREAGVPIQPVILADDKRRIGELLALAPADIQSYNLGHVDIIHLDDSRPSAWNAGVGDVIENITRMTGVWRVGELVPAAGAGMERTSTEPVGASRAHGASLRQTSSLRPPGPGEQGRWATGGGEKHAAV